MEQAQNPRDPEVEEEEGAMAAVRVAGEVLPPVPAETVFAKIVGKKLLMSREHPAMNSNVPSAGPP